MNNFDTAFPLVCKLEFEKVPDSKINYRTIKTSGCIPDNIVGDNGLTIEKNWSAKSGFEYSIYTQNEKAVALKCRRRPNLRGSIKARVTGFNLHFASPGMSFGDYGNDALLIAFSPDWEKFTIWIFEDAKVYSAMLFARWVSGELRLDIIEAQKFRGCR